MSPEPLSSSDGDAHRPPVSRFKGSLADLSSPLTGVGRIQLPPTSPPLMPSSRALTWSAPDTLRSRLPWHWEESGSYSNIRLTCYLKPLSDPGHWLMWSRANLGERGTRRTENRSISLQPTQSFLPALLPPYHQNNTTNNNYTCTFFNLKNAPCYFNVFIRLRCIRRVHSYSPF